MKKMVLLFESYIKGIIFTFLIIFIIGCKKDHQDYYDYRDQFLGNFSFTTNQYYTTSHDSTFLDTTFNYNGSITKAEFDNSIYIQFCGSLKNITSLYDNGRVDYGIPISSDTLYGLHGAFEGTNRIKFIFRLGDLNGFMTDSVIGIRR